MFRKLLIILILLLALFPQFANAQNGVVLVIVDALGSSYIYSWHSPTCIDGSKLPLANLGGIDKMNALYELWVPVPETEHGHSVIVTGYSGASSEMLSYYDSTIFDALKKDGYLCIAVMETGDTTGMIGKQDAAVHDKDNSVSAPEMAVAINKEQVPQGLVSILDDASFEPPKNPKGGDQYVAYDNWSLEKANRIVHFMSESCPDQNYFLTINVGGVDEAGHNGGYAEYRHAIEGLSPDLSVLIDACRATNTTLVLTADHGMSFGSATSKGSHESEPAASRNESRLVPMAIMSPSNLSGKGIYGQECLAPTLLSLADCPDTLSLADGQPVPMGDRFSLYLICDKPSQISLDGPGVSQQVQVNGTWRFSDLAAGIYTISNGQSTMNVSVSHDETITLSPEKESNGVVPPVQYILAALVPLAGIAIALGLIRRR